MSMFNRSFLSCELIGNLGQEPKSVQTKTGKPMATFTVAVTTSVKDADGNWSNQTQWVGCTTFGGFAERAPKVLHKGTMVLVKGEPAVRQFTETAAGSLRIHSDGGMRHSSIPESAPAQGTLISQPCAKVLP